MHKYHRLTVRADLDAGTRFAMATAASRCCPVATRVPSNAPRRFTDRSVEQHGS